VCPRGRGGGRGARAAGVWRGILRRWEGGRGGRGVPAIAHTFVEDGVRAQIVRIAECVFPLPRASGFHPFPVTRDLDSSVLVIFLN